MLASDGSLNENGAPFSGIMRYDARMAIEEALKEKVHIGLESLLPLNYGMVLLQ
jgi:valyl-tRNA synthetase